MSSRFAECKFFQKFRVPVEQADDLLFLVQVKDKDNGQKSYVENAKLKDINVKGLGLVTNLRLSLGSELEISLHFHKDHLDLEGTVVRAIDSLSTEEVIYAIEIEHEPKLEKFLEKFIQSFTPERAKECLTNLALQKNYTEETSNLETFSSMLSLFEETISYGREEEYLIGILNESVRVLNAHKASIYMINSSSNKLETVAGTSNINGKLKFDYRLGMAGSVFTTGVPLNIDILNDKVRFNDRLDKYSTQDIHSIICYPISNFEDKVIGVVEVLNKKNHDRFSEDDEKIMKNLVLVLSSLFYDFDPTSVNSRVRRFSEPYDRDHALVGKSLQMAALRKVIVKLKDLNSPLLIMGEAGVGKVLTARIVHEEGKRCVYPFDVIECDQANKKLLGTIIFAKESSPLCNGGTIVLKDVDCLPLEMQRNIASKINQGSTKSRIVSTTKKDLVFLVDKGEFDKKLYGYISQTFVKIDPLRKRPSDLIELIRFFVKIACQKQGLLEKSFSERAIKKMKNYDWPGNIKELKTCVERAVLYNPKAHMIGEASLSNSIAPLVDVDAKKRIFEDISTVMDHKIPLKERLAIVERQMILNEIKRVGGRSNAAQAMGISREALRKKLLNSEKITEKYQEGFTSFTTFEKKKSA